MFIVSLSLSSERAATSSSESGVIVTSLLECLRYCILHSKENEEHQRKISTMLISQQVGSHSCAYISHNFQMSHCIFVLCSCSFCH